MGNAKNFILPPSRTDSMRLIWIAGILMVGLSANLLFIKFNLMRRLPVASFQRIEWYGYASARYGAYFNYPEVLNLSINSPEGNAVLTNQRDGAEKVKVTFNIEDNPLSLSAEQWTGQNLQLKPGQTLKLTQLPAATNQTAIAEIIENNNTVEQLAYKPYGLRMIVMRWEGKQQRYFKGIADSIATNTDRKIKSDPRAANLSNSTIVVSPQAALSARQFKNLYYTAELPSIRAITVPPSMLGDVAADQRIRSLASARGYRLQFEPTTELQTAEGERLLPEAAKAWIALTQNAAQSGIKIGLNSGYRSVEDQKKLFLDSLNVLSTKQIGRNYSGTEIASGTADAVLNATLQTVAPPGYSRHHSGYTVDVKDSAASNKLFQNSASYRWLSQNNYQNALKFGFIPSYPEGAEAGPEPESWEYVWVGNFPDS